MPGIRNTISADKVSFRLVHRCENRLSYPGYVTSTKCTIKSRCSTPNFLFLHIGSAASILHSCCWTDYCNALSVGLPLKMVQKLQWVSNAVALLVTGAQCSGSHVSLCTQEPGLQGHPAPCNCSNVMMSPQLLPAGRPLKKISKVDLATLERGRCSEQWILNFELWIF